MSLTSNCETRWRAVPPSALASREWDAEVVVYNDRTANTHLLDEFAAAILRELCVTDAGMAVGDLADALTKDPAGAATSGLTAAITAVLAEFDRLGLARAERP